jgi:hypothetical protein
MTSPVLRDSSFACPLSRETTRLEFGLPAATPFKDEFDVYRWLIAQQILAVRGRRPPCEAGIETGNNGQKNDPGWQQPNPEDRFGRNQTAMSIPFHKKAVINSFTDHINRLNMSGRE